MPRRFFTLPLSILALAHLLPLLPAVVAAPVEERAINLGWSYGSQKIRGVNLGGVSAECRSLLSGYSRVVADSSQWLVTEPWITPSLFDATGNDAIIDEYTFCQFQDRAVAETALRQHWNTWITENDIKWISGELLNLVRRLIF